jgi:hypothetical protein
MSESIPLERDNIVTNRTKMYTLSRGACAKIPDMRSPDSMAFILLVVISRPTEKK